MTFPSGPQHVISWEDQEATIVGVGGGLRSYEADGCQLLDGYAPDEMCTDARGQPLIPWPNRLQDGRYRFAGEEHQLPLSEPARRNAIHGLVRWARWDLARREAAWLTMTHRLYPQPGYPFLLDLALTYSLSDDGLRVELVTENRGREPAPFGAGQHPYLLPLAGSLDDMALAVPADGYLTLDERGIPTGRAPVAGTDRDFRAVRAIGDARLDAAYVDLERDDAGISSVLVRTGGRSLRLWMDDRYTSVMVFTGDRLPEPRRRRSLGIEPMSCQPNALATGEGIAVLEPGQRWRAAWGLRLTPDRD